MDAPISGLRHFGLWDDVWLFGVKNTTSWTETNAHREEPDLVEIAFVRSRDGVFYSNGVVFCMESGFLRNKGSKVCVCGGEFVFPRLCQASSFRVACLVRSGLGGISPLEVGEKFYRDYSPSKTDVPGTASLSTRAGHRTSGATPIFVTAPRAMLVPNL